MDKKELMKEIKSMRIKHDNFDENYKVGFNIAVGRILLLANKLYEAKEFSKGAKE